MFERAQIADVAQVYELWKVYTAACNTGDFERWMTLWTEDAIQMPPNDLRRVGIDAIRCGMRPGFELFETSNMIIHTEEVRIFGDRAYSHGTYTYDMTPKDGGEMINLSGKFLDILEKQTDGSWKIAIDCHNCNLPVG
jgi:uncharacterized protein (TIGR02246 family)